MSWVRTGGHACVRGAEEVALLLRGTKLNICDGDDVMRDVLGGVRSGQSLWGRSNGCREGGGGGKYVGGGGGSRRWGGGMDDRSVRHSGLDGGLHSKLFCFLFFAVCGKEVLACVCL